MAIDGVLNSGLDISVSNAATKPVFKIFPVASTIYLESTLQGEAWVRTLASNA